MGKQTLNDLLSKARDELYDKNIITLLGEANAGKTVASALFKHALFDKFIPLHNGRFEAIVVKGGEEADNVIRGMKVDCTFPSATIRVDAPQMELAIYKMSGDGAGKSTVILQDSSGESYMSLLHKEFDDPEKRLNEILTDNNENQDIGPLAPYVFSKVYLLVIECPDNSSNWDVRQPSSAIYGLYKIHMVAKLTHNEKVRTHIAILFTKSDRLPDSDRDKPASELLERIPQLKSVLSVVHGGKLECFKLSIDVEQESPQDRDQRVGRLLQQANDNLQREQNDYEQKLTKSIDESATRAKKEGASEYSGKALEQYIKEAKSKAEQKFCSLHQVPILKFNADEENKIKHKVKEGFTYSQDEYVRLIDWIIDRLHD